MAKLAHRLKLHFTVKDTPLFQEELLGLHLFQQGHTTRLCHLIHGRHHGYRIMACDYRFETGSGGNRNNRSFSLVAVSIAPPSDSSNLTYPAMVGIPNTENLWPLGPCRYYSCKPKEDDAFDRYYSVFTENPQAAAKILSPRLQEALLAHSGYWEIICGWMVFYVEETLGLLALAKRMRHAERCRRLLLCDINPKMAG